jgi:hypothetical protein
MSHKNIFNILSSDASFIYRAEMAESMGMFLLQSGDDESQNLLTAEQFYEHYQDEMEDLINDSDYIVKIAMIISCGNLIN